jgi:Kef-type K+ transport system membrane component KefB
MKALQTVTAVIELGAGFALLCFPSITVGLLVGAPLETPAALTVARVGGAGLLALGVACWLARGDTQSRAARGLVVAMLLYDVAAVAVLAFAGIGFGLHGVALWPAVVLHAVMTVWCVMYLLRSRSNVRMDGNLRKQSNTERGPQ